ncbi:MAG: tetratricopeptide repeat protein [Pseudomonadota bacterium]
MLQDLDARGSQAGSAMQAEIRPVGLPERRLPVAQIAVAAGVTVLALAAAGVWWMKREPALPAVVVLAAPAPAPVVPKVVATNGGQARLAAPAVSVPANAAPLVEVKDWPPAAPAKARAARVPAPAKESAVRVAEVRQAPLVGGRDMNDAQRSETLYRQANAALEDGRVPGAIELLEQTLKLNPRHDAARQSLVALLIEAGRQDEAMRQLEQALAIDAAQPSLAMLLARMQIERGSPGVPTLLRSLPAAGANADYRAFLAGALQREQRHKEAVVQYAAALRSAPDNGVWLMGMGISLQADKRNAEALAAYQRARESGTLTAPLLAFVERKIGQLSQ